MATIALWALFEPRPSIAANVTVDMTGQITLDCLMNNYFTPYVSYGHGDMFICHSIELTVTGPLVQLNWNEICQQSPTDNRCAYWGSAGCCVYCGSSGGSHAAVGTLLKPIAPGTYTESYSASPVVAGNGATISGYFQYAWTPDGNIGSLNACAGTPVGSGNFTVKPNQNGTFTLIIPDLGQTTQLDKIDGDGQKALLGQVLKPLSVKVTSVDSTGAVRPKAVPISWTIKDPNGAIISQFATATDVQTGISVASPSVGNIPGAYSISAYCAACAANQQVTFTASALTQEQATKLVLLSCDPAGVTGEVETNPMRVQAVNFITGQGVTQLPIQFSGAASVSPTSDETDVNGEATTAVTLPSSPGTYTLTAACARCQANPTVACATTAQLPPESRAGSSSGGPGVGPAPAPGDYNIAITFQVLQPFIAPNPRKIIRPTIDHIGVFQGDTVRFAVDFTPPQSNLTDPIAWSGASAGNGQTLDVVFNTVGFTQETATVGQKTVTVIVEVGALPSMSLEDFCTSGTFALLACGLNAPQLPNWLSLAQHSIAWAQSQAPQFPDGMAGLRNGHGDSIRHTYWNALMTQNFGAAIARGISFGHEYDDIYVRMSRS